MGATSVATSGARPSDPHQERGAPNQLRRSDPGQTFAGQALRASVAEIAQAAHQRGAVQLIQLPAQRIGLGRARGRGRAVGRLGALRRWPAAHPASRPATDPGAHAVRSGPGAGCWARGRAGANATAVRTAPACWIRSACRRSAPHRPGPHHGPAPARATLASTAASRVASSTGLPLSHLLNATWSPIALRSTIRSSSGSNGVALRAGKAHPINMAPASMAVSAWTQGRGTEADRLISILR